MKQQVPLYDSRQFSWDGTGGAAFYTDLAGRGQLYKKLYDDAEDRAFNVLSRRTGEIKTFLLVEITKSDPKEFIFHSLDDNRGGTGAVKIRILNT